MILKKNKFKFSIVILILIFIFMIVHNFHSGYNYPMHLDEYHHIAQSMQIIEKKGFVSTNPYFAEPIRHENLEPGFHILLSELFLLTGMDPVQHYGFLPALFACLSAFMLFVLVNKITNNFWTGVFAMVFFASLKSSVNILGINFFTPLTACIPLIYLFLLMLTEALSDGDIKRLFISIILSACLVIIYPLCGTLIIPIAFLYFLLNPGIIRRFYSKTKEIFAIEKLNKDKISYFKTFLLTITIILVISVIFIYFWRYISFSRNKAQIIESLIFKEGWGKVEIKYFLPYLYGIIPTMLALIGMIISFKQKKYLIFVFFTFITIGLTSMFNKFGFTILSPYQRTLYFAMMFLIPLSAIGLSYITNSIKKLKMPFLSRVAKEPIVAFLVVAIFIGVFSSHYKLIDERRTYSNNIINEEDYKTIKWLEENYGSHNIVLAPIFVSSTIYPISRNYVVSILPGQLRGENLNASINFFNVGCNEKRMIVEENKANLVFSKGKIDCNWLKEVYNNKNFVYDVLT